MSQVDLSVPRTKASKHRPQSLKLKNHDSDNSDLALRIVSPGLPPLDNEMKTTVQISQKIEQQQRSLIAARHERKQGPMSPEQNDSDKSSDESGNESNDQPASQNSTEIPQLTEESDTVMTPLSTKRLKRDNVPTPLNISQSNKNPGMKPLIQSAPIKQGGSISGASSAVKYTLSKTRYQPQIQMRTQKSHAYQYRPVHRRRYNPLPRTQVTYLAFPPATSVIHGFPHRYNSMVPYTTISPYFPTAARNNLHHSGSLENSAHPHAPKADSKRVTGPVTDVYHGDYTKAAPLQSQPLSAQRGFFDQMKSKQNADEDRLPASEDEMKEMSQKYMESKEAQEDSQSEEELMEEEIFGSINLMNDSIFNFKIFKQPHSSPGCSKKGLSASPSSSSTSSQQSSKGDWLSKEKEKFLKICETSWDEFVSNRFDS
ncbi:uncharacterized protein PRCAT00001984001 [Priceomyces carsonii]|uniref:uncharacterized protein n=1 Tax=Priceomyces carsonii TaxID=28549 RepID=UPI002ED8D6B4|nr:unnamed protein product [Priceomyces carsonii]